MKPVRVMRYRGVLLRIVHNGSAKGSFPYEWTVGRCTDRNPAVMDAWPHPGRPKTLHDPTSWNSIAGAIQHGRYKIDYLLDEANKPQKPIFNC